MLPEAFLQRMQTLLGTDYASFLTAMEQDSAVKAWRENPFKRSTAPLSDLLSVPCAPIPYAEDAYFFEAEGIGNHPLHHAGAFYVQDPGAMATVHALQIQKGWRVADFCASPGGKSSQLAAYIGQEGFLLSNEINPSRCKVLAGNLERLGCPNVMVTNVDAATVAAWYPAFFDLVLVDAPCSGEGMFRKYEHAAAEWSEENVKKCAERQFEILQAAEKTVKVGGYLLYSTCTFAPEENEMTVDRFLSAYPEFEACEISPSVQAVTSAAHLFDGCAHPEQISRSRRFYPHVFDGEGQYMCLLRRTDGITCAKPLNDAAKNASATEKALILDFFAKNFCEDIWETLAAYELYAQGELLYLKRRDIPQPSFGVLVPGILLGTARKGRLEPHHTLFSVLGHYMRRKICHSSQDEEVKRYLHGETFATSLDDGYAVLLVDGCPLGGIKVSQGMAKNHYPKGLRTQKA